MIITQAESLSVSFECEYLVADRSYDADDFVQLTIGRGVTPVIPPRKNRKEQRDYDPHLYQERHLVECFINKIKYYRRLFSRFEKLASRFLAFLSFAGARIWLR